MIPLAGHGKDPRLVQPYILKVIELPFDENISESAQRDENYTPDYFIEACRAFLGWFDLDPFSNAIAQRTIKARTFWTKDDNALIKDWTPYVKKFVNPPYSQGLVGKCINKIIEFCAIGETILVVNSSTSAKWFQRCKDASSAYLNPSKRLPFYNPYREIQYLNGSKKRSGNEYDQTVFYFGDRPLEFAKGMEHLGSCSIPIKKSAVIEGAKSPVFPIAIATGPNKSVANLRMDEGSISVLVENYDDRLDSLLEQRDKLINSGASPQGVWINCGKVPNRDFKQAVWKSDKPQPQWGDKKSHYIGRFMGDEHLSAIAQHKAGQKLRAVEREIKKLQVKS